MRRQRTASVAFILITFLLDTLGVGMIFPVLPRLVASFTGGDLSEASSYYGAFISLFPAMQFLFAPIMGGLSDRFGRRPVVLSALAFASLSYVLLSFAPNLGWLFFGRALAGITGSSYSAAGAYIADVTPPEKRAQNFGLMGAAAGLGFTLGPVIGGFVGAEHPRLTFLVAALLNLLNFLYGVFVLPESLPPERRRPFSLARTNSFAVLAKLRKQVVIRDLIIALTCTYVAQNILESSWALYTDHRFQWGPREIGLSLATAGVATAIVQGLVLRALMPRLGEKWAIIIGFLIRGASDFAFGFTTQGWMMYTLIAPYVLGGIVAPAVQALVSKQGSSSDQGELQGVQASLASLAAVTAPLIATGLFGHFSARGNVPYLPGAPFIFAACVNGFGLLIAIRLFAWHPKIGRE